MKLRMYLQWSDTEHSLQLKFDTYGLTGNINLFYIFFISCNGNKMSLI